MQAKGSNHLHAIFHGFVEFIGFFPVFLLVGVLFLKEPLIYGWFGLLFGLFIVLYFFNIFLSNRWYTIICGVVFSLLGSIVIAPSIWAIVASVIFSFMASYRGIQHAENDWDDILPSRVFWAISLPVYFVGYLIFAYFDLLVSYKELVSYAGFLFVIIMLFVTNRQHLQKESLAKGKQKLNAEMTRLNRFYLIITVLLVFVITNFQVIQAALFNGVRSIIESIIWFAELFGNDTEVREEPPQQNQMPMLPDGDAEPSQAASWMDSVMQVIGLVMAVVLILLFVAVFFKKIRNALKKIILFIWQQIKQVFGKKKVELSQTDFSDEKENLFDWKKWRKQNQDKMAQAFRKITKRKPKFEQLSINEKVRFVYRFLAEDLKKQEKWKESFTAQEVLSLTRKEDQLQQLKTWYDDIRYGNQELQDDTEERINQLWIELEEKS